MDSLIFLLSKLLILNLILIGIGFAFGWFIAKLRFQKLRKKLDEAELEIVKLEKRADYAEKRVTQQPITSFLN